MYTYEGVTYPGVTGILKILDKSGPLMGWAARQTAEAVLGLIHEQTPTDMPGVSIPMSQFYGVARLLDSVGPEGFIKAVTSRSAWKNDEAKDMGSRIHELTELLDAKKDTGPMTPTEALRVEHYRTWRDASGWDLKVREAVLVNPELGFGGTLDILARDRDGRSVLADIKTGKGVYKESILQLAAYGLATFIQPEGASTVSRMPKVDRYAILHVTAKGVREIEIPIGDEDRSAFLACMDLTRWSDSQKGRAL
jgi:hypothetical protein